MTRALEITAWALAATVWAFLFYRVFLAVAP